MKLQHKFVELMPSVLDEGVIYVSIEYETAIHKCVCGCGNKVVTPITPTDWILSFDGETISLYPSIGNWSLECKSHYYIKRNEILFIRQEKDQENKVMKRVKTNKKNRLFKKRKPRQ